ncbi:MAG: carboxypeptidase regulatory-like domain-containing protein [Acidobacteriota bacterium]
MRGHVLLVVAACGASAHVRRPNDGTIAGIARDHDSGTAVAKAQVQVRRVGELAARTLVTGRDGRYALPHLPPGRYSLDASFAGQPIDVENIAVHAGDTAVVDLVFTLGRPDPVHIDFGDPKAGAIDHYRPPHLAATRAIIEGTVNDAGSHDRVAGAVVTVVGSGMAALQTVSDDEGRYRFEATPGVYAVSAYYAIGGRAQIEVRRSDIHVAGAEAVVVPLWVELAGQ